jgi:hypothetical protein
MLMRNLQRGLLLATVYITVLVALGLVATILLQSPAFSGVVDAGAFLGSGVALIVGACLMSRQPLRDEDRLNPDGSHTPAWRRASLGRQLLIAALIIFLCGFAISSIGGYFQI